MEAFLVSAGVVALAEVGDKTQLLAFVLAARFRKPGPVIAGILTATLINHSIAGAVGGWVVHVLGPDVLRFVLAASFLGMAGWCLIPDRLEPDAGRAAPRYGAYGTTVMTFFLAEMGDKTQLATVALAAKYATVYAVVAGTTVGMLLADVPAVLLGDRLAGRLPSRPVRAVAALVFAALGAVVLVNGAGGLLG